MKKMLLTLCLLATITSSAFGFATIVTSVKGGDTITFTSNVDNVIVQINGQSIGKISGGALKYKLKRDGEDKTVTFRKSGYRDEEAKIYTEFDNLYWGNVVSGGTFGSSTDSWSTKSTRQFTPNQFYVEMTKR